MSDKQQNKICKLTNQRDIEYRPEEMNLTRGILGCKSV